MPSSSIRILTYNVRRCLGIDGQLSPARVAAAIAECQPDIVALQELDVSRKRTDNVDQAREIARELNLRHVYFFPAMRVLEEEYGDAIITDLPSRLVKAGALPGLARRPGLEPRGALWATITAGGAELQVINTHFGLKRPERLAQAEAIVGEEWLGHEDCIGPTILLGDFNSVPRGRVYRRLTGRLRDAHTAGASPKRPGATFPANFPLFRIDHMLVSPEVEVISAGTVRTPLARVASDHLPLVAEVRVNPRLAAQPAVPGKAVAG